MTLSHSRYRYVEFTFSQDQVSWARLHINAFKFFRGIPVRIILDNLKAGVIVIGQEYWPKKIESGQLF